MYVGGLPWPLQFCLQDSRLALTYFPVSELVSVPVFLILPFSWDLGNSWDKPSCEDGAKYSQRRKQCEAVESTYTKETHQDEQTQRSLGRDCRQSQNQPLGRYHGAASSLPSTPGQPFLPALLQAICHPVSSQWHLEFIIYCGQSRERDTGRVGDKKLHPGPFQQWRGDKTIPWPKQDLRSPKPQERGPCPCL